MAREHNPVGWFEIPVTDIDRATGFYRRIFGIDLQARRMGDALVAMFPSAPGSTAPPACWYRPARRYPRPTAS